MKYVKRCSVAKRGGISSNARRALVISYVNQGLVHSQGDLVDLLADEGIDVTQATASRDLDDVGAVRGKDAGGVMRYQLMSSEIEPLARMARVSDELVLSITASGNLVVVKTPPGGAQLLASALDRASQSGELSAIIGTIAGDDTVLVISRNATGGKALAEQLRDFIGSALAKNLTKKLPKKLTASSRKQKARR
jgi:transcriptional regulator of arginine metabolism